MFITPSWLLTIPDPTDPNYFNWLVTKAAVNSVPDHVIEHLVKRYFSLPLPDGLSNSNGDIILYYSDNDMRLHVIDKLEDLLFYE